MQHDVYISSSWKQRDQVRQLAEQLQEIGLTVYDFTNPACRDSPEIPPEEFPEQFDPEKHDHGEYLQSVPEWCAAMEGNRKALGNCSIVILLLPCGLDAHADAYYALGRGKRLIVCGSPHKGDRTLTHLWAEIILPSPQDVVAYLKEKKMADCPECGSRYVELVDECPVCELPGCTKCMPQGGICPECLKLPLVDTLHEAFRLKNLPNSPKMGDAVGRSETLSSVSNPMPELRTNPSDWADLRVILDGNYMRDCLAKRHLTKFVEALTDLEDLYRWANTPKKVD